MSDESEVAAGGRRVVLRKLKNLMDLTADGRAPLSAEAEAVLTPRLEYNRVVQLVGRAVRRDPHTGERIYVDVQPKRLYKHDDRGRLICGAGWIDTAAKLYRAAGYAVDYYDLTRRNAEILTPDWSRLAGRPEFRRRKGDRAALDALLADAGRVDSTDNAQVALARRVKQREIVDAVLARVSYGLNGVVQVPPGVGKSFCLAAYMLLFPKARIDIAVPDVDNAQKTWRHLSRYSPNVGLIGGGGKTHGRVTVFVGPSLHHAKLDADILFVDEVHKFMADNLAAKLGVVTAGTEQHPGPVCFGFSATPRGRRDGTDARLEGLFGPVVYRMAWPEATRLGLVAPIRVEWLHVANGPVVPDGPVVPRSLGYEDINARKRHLLWRNVSRNTLIADRARAVPAGEQVLIMVEKIEHALCLKKLLPDFELVYGQHDVDKFLRYERQGDVDVDFEQMTPALRQRRREAFETGELRRVIATDVWATGVSFDALSVLFRGDGRESPILDEQIPGRVSRAHADKPAALVVDCDDAFDARLKLAASKRAKNYEEKSWSQSRPDAATTPPRPQTRPRRPAG